MFFFPSHLLCFEKKESKNKNKITLCQEGKKVKCLHVEEAEKITKETKESGSNKRKGEGMDIKEGICHFFLRSKIEALLLCSQSVEMR